MDLKKEPDGNVPAKLTNSDIVATFKNVKPRIKEYLASQSVGTNEEIKRILYLTMNKLSKSSLSKKLTQEIINGFIIKKLKEATQVVFLKRHEKGKILTLLETCVLNNNINNIFKEIETAVFSNLTPTASNE